MHFKRIKSKRERIIFFSAAAALLVVLIATLSVLIFKICTGTLWVPKTAAPISTETEAKAEAPQDMLGGYITVGKDVIMSDEWKESVKSLLSDAHDNGFTCVVVPLAADNKVIYKSSVFKSTEVDYLEYIVKTAHKYAMTVYASADPLQSPKGQYDVTSADSVKDVSTELCNVCIKYKVDGIVLSNLKLKSDNPSYKMYSADGGSMGYDKYAAGALKNYVREVCVQLRKSAGGKCVGVSVSADRYDEAKAWSDCGATDFTMVTDNSFDLLSADGFHAVSDKWLKSDSGIKRVYFVLDASEVGSDETHTDDALADQAAYLVSNGADGILIDSFSATANAQKLLVYLSTINNESYGIHKLTVTSPSSHEFTTYTDTVSFIGASDPSSPLTINDTEVKRTDTGYFSVDEKLKQGENIFVIKHKKNTETYKITYRKTLIKAVYPDEESYYNGGTAVTVSAVARQGCSLTARVGNSVQKMTAIGASSNDSADNFVSYIATFTMPQAQDTPIEVGKLIVSAKLGKDSENVSGGKLIVRSAKDKSEVQYDTADKAYQSGYGIEVGVGDRYVAEISKYQMETLDIVNPIDERSRPTNAYLPQGTVDYCDDNDSVFYNPETGNTNTFRNLAYGKRIYTTNGEGVAIFKAKLPSTNTLTAVGSKDDGHHTVLTFDVAWKAPFNVTLAPQDYDNPYPASGRPSYAISSTTYQYVDIEFCYTAGSSCQGTVDVSASPVFSSAEWVKGANGNYNLRLWLRKAGSFYGWTAKYNDKNQLEFYFLDPAVIKQSNNGYGYDLSGVTVVIDAGHGGPKSPGAVGSSKEYTEAVLNLILAKKVQRELENIGATVVMTRTTDKTVSLDERARITTNTMPDAFVSIHRNSSASSSARGYDDYYFEPYSKALADSVYGPSASNFTTGRGSQFYPFYVTRVSCCPSILTENGFMSNSSDLEMIKTDWHNEALACSITQGIVNYFASIQ